MRMSETNRPKKDLRKINAFFANVQFNTLHRVLGTDMTLKISNINKIYIFETLGA